MEKDFDGRQYTGSTREPIAKHAPLSPQEEATISRLFYKPRTGFMNTYKLQKKSTFYPSLRNINTAQIKDWYWKQPVNQVHRQDMKPKVYTSIAGEGPGTNLQMDFLIYKDHKFQGYTNILCIVDVFSRKAFAYATTTREGPTYTRLFKEMVENELGGVWPKHLNCDNEFIYSDFVRMLGDNRVEVHFSEVGESNKNSLVERFIRTLRGMLEKATWALNMADWPKLLPKLIENYNDTYHKTIRARPNQVFDKEEPSGQILKYAPYDFLPGDRVRIKIKESTTFAKGERQKLSTELYTLDRKEGNKWILRDVEEGTVYNDDPVKPKDLQKVGDVWTTVEKEAEKKKEESEEKEREAERQPQQPLPQELEREKEQQERESGPAEEAPAPPPRAVEEEEVPLIRRRKRLRRTPTLPTQIKQQRQEAEKEKKLEVVRRELGSFNSEGQKSETLLRPKRGRVPNTKNLDLGYHESVRKRRK